MLSPSTDTPVRVDPAFRDEMKASHIACNACGSILPRNNGLDLVVADEVGKILDKYDLSFASGRIDLGIISRRFWDALDEAGASVGLLQGQISAAAGRAYPDWYTFVGKYPVIVRGTLSGTRGKPVSTRKCNGCGRQLYFAFGKYHLFEGDIAAPVPVMVAYGKRLVIREDVYEKLDLTQMTGFHIHKVPLLDEPLDGIAEPLIPYPLNS